MESDSVTVHVLEYQVIDGWRYRLSIQGDSVQVCHVIERRLADHDPWLYVCDALPGDSIADCVDHGE